MSFKPEVIADQGGQWSGNAMRFATEAEALANVKDLEGRWILVTATRVVPSDDPINYRWDFSLGRALLLDQPPVLISAGRYGYHKADIAEMEAKASLSEVEQIHLLQMRQEVALYEATTGEAKA